MTIKQQMQNDLKQDLPTWIYRAIATTLMSVLLAASLWIGSRLLAGVDRTSLDVTAVREQLIKLDSRLEDHERRLGRVESRIDHWPPSYPTPQP